MTPPSGPRQHADGMPASSSRPPVPFPGTARVPASVAAALALGAGLAACSTFTPTLQDRYAVDDHRLWLSCAGQGRPTVVVDVAFGGDARDWRDLQDELRDRVRVCVYDRAGYGLSDGGPLPRDARRVADELRSLLRSARLAPPYVLVGHSLGGLHALVFAHRHREATAGLMLLDPPPGLFLRGQRFPELREEARAATRTLRRQAEALRGSADRASTQRAVRLRTLASEHEALFGRTAAQAAAVDSLGALPLVVLASGRPDPDPVGQRADFRDYWIGESRELAGLSSAGRFRLVRESTDDLRVDAPGVVLEELRRLLDRAGAGG